MKRVVNLMHRQAVKVKAEGLFFKVSSRSSVRALLLAMGSAVRFKNAAANPASFHLRFILSFQVTTLELFNRILDDQKMLPRDSAYKELIQMINFLLRKFFKAVQESPFLVVEVSSTPQMVGYTPYDKWIFMENSGLLS